MEVLSERQHFFTTRQKATPTDAQTSQSSLARVYRAIAALERLEATIS
jgi:hypothetical protein